MTGSVSLAEVVVTATITVIAFAFLYALLTPQGASSGWAAVTVVCGLLMAPFLTRKIIEAKIDSYHQPHEETPQMSITAIETEPGKRIEGKERAAIRRDVVKAYKAGTSVREISKEMGRSYGFVHSLLEEANVKFRPRGGKKAAAKPKTKKA